jgi:hypothetical protein
VAEAASQTVGDAIHSGGNRSRAAAGRQPGANGPVLELVLTTGERLRIGGGVDAAVFRAVLETLRGDALAGKCAGVSMPDTLRHAQEL